MSAIISVEEWLMWIYCQKSGALYDASMAFVASGYAGAGEGKNNPDKQTVKNVGPLPIGIYRMGEPRDDASMGPFVIPLTPDSGNQMHDRSGFFIHGDSISKPGTASEGCPIFPRAVRQKLAASKDRWLVVVRDLAT